MRISLSIYVAFRVLIVTRSAPKLGPLSFDPLLYESEPNQNIEPISETSNEWLSMSFNSEAITNKDENPISTAYTNYPEATTKKPTTRPNSLCITKTTKTFKQQNAYLRDNNPKKKTKCTEYDYNPSLCKIINDRLLCGYNKNKGKIQTETPIDVGNGCHIRGDRFECGYMEGPFNTFLRRPPARDPIEKHDNKQLNTAQETRRMMTDKFKTTKPTSKPTKTIKITPNDTTKPNNPKLTLNITLSITTIPPLKTEPIQMVNKTKPQQYCVEKNGHIFCHSVKLN